jgi:hypothetical protein
MDRHCDWPREPCEVCEAEDEAAEQAWRERQEAWYGREPESPPDPWIDESRPSEEPF